VAVAPGALPPRSRRKCTSPWQMSGAKPSAGGAVGEICADPTAENRVSEVTRMAAKMIIFTMASLYSTADDQ
jgi:hypothetical protein